MKPAEVLAQRYLLVEGYDRPDIVLGRRAVRVDTALRLGRYFRTIPEFWINLQTRYDPDIAERTIRAKIELEITPHAA